MNDRMFFMETGKYNYPVFAYQKGGGFSFYRKTPHGERFIFWLKGDAATVAVKYYKKKRNL